MKKKPTKKFKILQRYVAKKIPINNDLNKDDLEKRITDCLFKVSKSRKSEIKSIHVLPGDTIRGDDKRLYIVQESRKPIPATTPPIKVKPRLIYDELTPYIRYGKEKTLALKKGISPPDFIQELTNEVNKLLELKNRRNLVNEDYALKRFRGETISREDRKFKRFLNEQYSPSDLIRDKRQQIYNLIQILQNSIIGMNSARIIIHYLSKILFATGIEKGSFEDIKRNAQVKYRDLICPDQHLS